MATDAELIAEVRALLRSGCTYQATHPLSAVGFGPGRVPRVDAATDHIHALLRSLDAAETRERQRNEDASLVAGVELVPKAALDAAEARAAELSGLLMCDVCGDGSGVALSGPCACKGEPNGILAMLDACRRAEVRERFRADAAERERDEARLGERHADAVVDVVREIRDSAHGAAAICVTPTDHGPMLGPATTQALLDALAAYEAAKGAK